jgi:hypothetical protein
MFKYSEAQAKVETPYETEMEREDLVGDLAEGRKLDNEVQRSMESRYGHSLDHVRIHTDASADNFCQRFEAKAFALDNHMAFRKGHYQPHTAEGEQLLRHEVTHVLNSSANRGAEADLGTALSSDCTACCSSPKRKIICVVTDDATVFGRLAGVPLRMPMVSTTQFWDHHWYRKDADRSWSHKRGGSPARQDDAAGTSPICNPCNASRTYTGPNVDYKRCRGLVVCLGH